MRSVSLGVDVAQIVMRDELERLRKEIQEYYATKEELAKQETRHIKWMVGFLLGSAAFATTLAVFIQRLIR